MRIFAENKLIYPDLSYVLCGLCFKVHNKLGRYRNKKQYGDALELLLKESKIVYEREKMIEPSFAGEGKRSVADFIIEDKIVLELKAKEIVAKNDYYQVMRYLISANKKLGILINFRQHYLRPKRILNPKI